MKVRLKNPKIEENYGEELLHLRGIEDVDTFLHPDNSCLQTYEQLTNIKAGVELVASLPENARIALIVDSDTDGYTSAAILYQYLAQIQPNWIIDYFLHSGKGHGLEEHWETLRDAEIDLLIVPDAGSNDSQYIDEIQTPTLVIDHHILESEHISKYMTLINNQISPQYKNKALSGAGMAYQFCRALDDYYDINRADDYLDLAALGICSDMMSGLEIENQYFWHDGFKHVKNPFFRELARKQAYSITGSVSPSDKEIMECLNPTTVAFYITPLINALIRVGTQWEKEQMFEAFIDGDAFVPSTKRGAKGTMDHRATEVARFCANARNHQNKILEDAMFQVEQKIFNYDLLNNKILFVRLDEEDFPSELNGLLAMKLSAKYKHPTIVARLGEDGYIKGSIRGLNNSELISFKDYLDSTGLCEYVQGHDNAAGISIIKSNLTALHDKANQDLAQFDFKSNYFEVDFARHALDKDLALLVVDLDKYTDCWSQNNPQPLIYVNGLHITKKDVQIMGKNKDTIKIMRNGVAYMKFFAKELIQQFNEIDGDIKVELVGKANLNEWNGTVTPQIFIDQIEVEKDDPLAF